jgi:Sulfotransferase domain
LRSFANVAYDTAAMLFDFLKGPELPITLHITHAKAGSTWVDAILRTLFGKRVLPRGYAMPVFGSGKERVFSVFMSRDEFLARPELSDSKRFIILRDLRDTLISRYFSIRETHKPDPSGKIEAQRAELRAMSVEDGLARVMEDAGMAATAKIQRSWYGSGEILLRYEDLLADDVALFTKLFVEQLGLPLTADKVERAVVENRFEKKYKRKLGEEDAGSHGRKGTPGDWRNHFTPRLAQRFQELYGDVLPAGGYETDAGWVSGVAVR